MRDNQSTHNAGVRRVVDACLSAALESNTRRFSPHTSIINDHMSDYDASYRVVQGIVECTLQSTQDIDLRVPFRYLAEAPEINMHKQVSRRSRRRT